MADIQATEVPVAPAFDVAGSAVTATATLHHCDLFGRQNNYDSCGYYSLLGSGIKALEDGEELSIYLRGNTEQQVPYYDSTVFEVTTDSTNGQQAITSIDTTKGFIVTETDKLSPEPGKTYPSQGHRWRRYRQCRADRHLRTGLLVPSEKQAAVQRGCRGACTYACAGILSSTILTANVPTRCAFSVILDYNNNNYYASYPVQGSPPPLRDPRYSQMLVDGTNSPYQSPPL
ncbi:hypothetical protein FHETE_11075 [Fusarium heterosporum]|uniref:Uncharacterized protein n=1 Tax=Fusarium heterosporum TaxID=42747 RepID=A0A8H5WFI2_FUSHE|nr:hypothetical protein FHETE_11075 [Fusarium heterosporum]